MSAPYHKPSVAREKKVFFRDRTFVLALLAGVVFWLIFGLLTRTRPQPLHVLLSWPFVFLAGWLPLGEEVLFRGLLQGTLRRYAWGMRQWQGITGANIATSIVFTLGHWWSHPPLWALAVLCPSLLFGYCRDRYDGIAAALVLHMFYNAGYFWLTGLPAITASGTQ